MNRHFRLQTDPVFLVGIALLMMNELILKHLFDSPFLHGYFNDLLLIPCALPILLRIHALLGLRDESRPPSTGEIVGHLAIWCVLFELAGPRLTRHSTGDALDVFAYCAGGAMAWLLWRQPRSNLSTGEAT